MRNSYGGELCTVKFTGKIPVWSETAYGVEWDNPYRGRHNGSLEGQEFFTCRVQGAGSFVKASKPADPSVSFNDGLKDKYMEQHQFSDVKLSTNKQIESVGMDKHFERHQNVKNLRIISLERCCINSFSSDEFIDLPNLRELNLACNLFEDLGKALQFLSIFALEKLDLRGNRFTKFDITVTLPTVTELNLGSTLITASQLCIVLQAFPNLQRLGLSKNMFDEYPIPLDSIPWIDLGYNRLEYLPKSGRAVVLSNNLIHKLDSPVRFDYLNICDQNTPTRLSLMEIDHLIVTDLWLSEAGYDRAAIIGRLAGVVKLNGTIVTEEERRESELYLLSQIQKRLQPPLPAERKEYLQSIYGAPKPYSSNSIAARLFQVRIAGEYYRVVGDICIRRLKVLISRKIGQRAICLSLKYNGRILEDDECVKQACLEGEDVDLIIDENRLSKIITAPPVVDERIPNMPHTDHQDKTYLMREHTVA